MERQSFGSFEAYWPHFVGAHRHPLNRGLHYIGTEIAVVGVAAGVATLNPVWMFGGPLVAYAIAKLGHQLIEKNAPAANLGHPLWAVRADLKMLAMALRGEMPRELVRLYGSVHPAPDAPLLASA